MQIVSHTIDEEGVDSIAIIFGDARFFRAGLNRHDESSSNTQLGSTHSTADDHLFVFVLFIEQIRHLARIEDVVHVLEKFFHDDLIVSEEEDSVLIVRTGLFVEFLQILVETIVIVATRQFDLKAFVATHVTGETSERLFPRSPDPDQKSIAPVLSNNSSDASNVFNGIHEEDQPGVFVVRQIVIFLVILENVANFGHVGDFFVKAFVLRCSNFHEITEDNRLLNKGGRFDLNGEETRGQFREHRVKVLFVFIVDQTIVKDTHRLVEEHAHQSIPIRDTLGFDLDERDSLKLHRFASTCLT